MSQNVKQIRMMKEIEHLSKNPSEEYKAGPLNNDLYTWHFTLRGPSETEFEEGIYHGQIIFPFNYPHEPPDIYFLTKSGRFEVNQKICLTITGFHADQWNSSWTTRLILEALISMFPEKESVMSVGSLNISVESRKKLAKESWNYQCEKCGPISNILKQREKKPAEVITKSNEQSQAKPEEKPETQENEKQIQIDAEKEQKNLDDIQLKLKILQEESQKAIPSIDNRKYAKREEINPFSQNQDDTTNISSREYSFNFVLSNLEEAMNVINSIKLIDINKDTSEQDNKNKKTNIPTSQEGQSIKTDQIKVEGEQEQIKESLNLDSGKEDNKESNSVINNSKEININQESNNLQDEQQLQSNLDQGVLSEDNNDNQNKKEESKEEEEEEVQDISKQNNTIDNDDIKIQQKQDNIEDQGESAEVQDIDDIDENNVQLNTKEEGMQKLKKLDTLILGTLIFFILYLTILFQISI